MLSKKTGNRRKELEWVALPSNFCLLTSFHPPLVHRLFEALRPVFRELILRNPFVVIAFACLLTVGGLRLASNLTIDTDLANLLPPEYPSVQAMERLRETVGGETLLDVGIHGPGFEENVRFAEALIPEMMSLRTPQGGPVFERYDFRSDTSFLAQHGLYFATDYELDILEDALLDQIEDARLAANPFFVDLDDDLFDDEDEDPADVLDALDRFLPREYFVSPDSTILAVRFLPTFNQTSLGLVRNAYAQVDSLLASMQSHPEFSEITAVAGGRLLRQSVEVEAITDDVQRSFLAGIFAVLLFVTAYFFYKALQVRGRSRKVVLQELIRTPLTAGLLGIPLLMSLSWTFGFAYLAFGSLNLMTSTLALLLFGISIDFGIHYYARYTEERGKQKPVEEAAENSFMSSGQAIMASALTTAAALYALMLADFRGFSEFGIIGGTGMLFAMIAMLSLLPALLVLAERFKLLTLDATPVQRAADSGRTRFPAAKPILIATILLTVVALFLLPRERFEYDFDRLEPDFPTYNERQAHISPAFPRSSLRNPAYIVVETPAQALAVADTLRARMQADTTIASVETPVERFPESSEAIVQRLGRLAEIRTLADDPFLRADTTGTIEMIRLAASPTEPIALDDVPDELKRSFMDRSGQIGRFVVVYPRGELSHDARLSMAFARDAGNVELETGEIAYAGSTSIIAADMLSLMLSESPLMIAITCLLIILVMYLIFRTFRGTMLSLLPLAVGILWMLGAMVPIGLALTFYNLVVLPAVIAIGNDCGVHLVHRYQEEGPGSIMRVLRSTGEHITVGALTTMIGFGGLLLSFHPGLQSLGQLAVLGIGAALIAALTFFPALVQVLENRSETPKSVE